MRKFDPPVVGKDIDDWRDARRACKRTLCASIAPEGANGTIGIDAGCTTNPGVADLISFEGSGSPKVKRVLDTTNNQAAWEAVLDAMRTAQDRHLRLVGVNRLVQEQAAGMKRCIHEELQRRLADYEDMLPRFETVTLAVVDRASHVAGQELIRRRPARLKAAKAAASVAKAVPTHT